MRLSTLLVLSSVVLAAAGCGDAALSPTGPTPTGSVAVCRNGAPIVMTPAGPSCRQVPEVNVTP